MMHRKQPGQSNTKKKAMPKAAPFSVGVWLQAERWHWSVHHGVAVVRHGSEATFDEATEKARMAYHSSRR
jgi:hypothetical protein